MEKKNNIKVVHHDLFKKNVFIKIKTHLFIVTKRVKYVFRL